MCTKHISEQVLLVLVIAGTHCDALSCRYLGQLLDGEDAVVSIRKGVDVLQQHVEALVGPCHCSAA